MSKQAKRDSRHKNFTTFQDFIDVTTKIWDRYLQTIYRFPLELMGGGSLLYPNIALFVETNRYYVLELFGSDEIFKGLTVKKHKEPNIYKYLYQFPIESVSKPAFRFAGVENGLVNLILSGAKTIEVFENRFGFIRNPKQLTTFRSVNATGPFIRFDDGFGNMFISRCLLLNSLDNAYRAKDIVHMEIVSKSHDINEYKIALENRLHRRVINSTDDLFGVQYAPELSSKSLLLSGQFANMFLVPKIRETTIGEFLKAHPQMINKAFDCKDFVYEPEMEWIEGNEKYQDEKSINPDLMIKRENGFFDIVDLKTITDTNKSITQGQHKRRRFIDYVNEGIAQLYNYKEYFNYEKNRNLVYSKYGIKVDNPKLILVVGSYDNVSNEEVREACRSYREQLEILDYDTLNSFYLINSTGSNPEELKP